MIAGRYSRNNDDIAHGEKEATLPLCTQLALLSRAVQFAP